MTSHHLTLPEMSPEMRLLLACARASLQQTDQEQVATLSCNGINWDMFINLVDRHRLIAMVYFILSKLEDNPVPEKFIQHLQNRYLNNARRALWLASNLVTLLQLFEREHIPVLALKGSVLALQVYGDLVSRHAGDVDLLIPPEYVQQAKEVLSRAGFRPVIPDFEMSPRQRETFMSIRCESEYYHRRNGLKVELHWSWFHNSYLFPLSLCRVWDQAQSITIDEYQVATLGNEDTIIYLCVHGAQHAWFRLFWLCDIAGLLNSDPGVDWERVVARAAGLGVLRALTQGVLLSNLLLESPVPEPIKDRVAPDRAVSSLVNSAFRALLRPEISLNSKGLYEHARSKLYDLKLRGDLRYKVFGCLGAMCTSPNDWSTLPLPDKLFPLYYPLRPFIRLWRLCTYSFGRKARRAV